MIVSQQDSNPGGRRDGTDEPGSRDDRARSRPGRGALDQQRPTDIQGDGRANGRGVSAPGGGRPSGQETPLHTHPAEQEAFYILDGQALIYLDGDERSLAAGGFVSVPPGVPHAYLVTSEVARLLILITPGSGTMEAFFREAAEPAAERVLPEVGTLDIERIAAAAERTRAVEILGPPPFGEPGA